MKSSENICCSVLLSIHKFHIENIKSLIKRIEVRKTKPNCKRPFRCFMYETKKYSGCGKVIGEFICRGMMEPNDNLTLMSKLSCVSIDDLIEYSNGKKLYGWRITDLVIYDKPKELSEFYTWKRCNSCRDTGYESTACIYDEDCKVPVPVTRPPQSWCYVLHDKL